MTRYHQLKDSSPWGLTCHPKETASKREQRLSVSPSHTSHVSIKPVSWKPSKEPAQLFVQKLKRVISIYNSSSRVFKFPGAKQGGKKTVMQGFRNYHLQREGLTQPQEGWPEM